MQILLSRPIHIRNRTALALGKYSSDPYLFISLCSHTAHLVCQRMLFSCYCLELWLHSLVSLSPCTAPPFMPHSYALYPDGSCDIVTHPLCSLYAIGSFPFHCDCHVTPVSVYISGVHSLYSLVLISQDFLFSCSICVNLQLAIPRSYLPRPLYSYPYLSHCQDLVKGLHRMSASPFASTVP